MAGRIEIMDPGGYSAGVNSIGQVQVTTGSAAAGTSLNAVTANGNGSTIDFVCARSNITVVVTATGAPAAGTVTLQVSHDGVNWFATATTATAGATVTSGTLSNGAWRYARAVLSALSGGTSPTVTATLMAA